jgi:hypothetical protein
MYKLPEPVWSCLDAIQQWDMAIAKFAYADFIVFYRMY